MFYLGLMFLLAGLIPISELVDDFFFYLGDPYFFQMMRYDLNEYGYGFLVVIVAIVLIIIGWKRVKKHYRILRALGILLMLSAVIVLFDDDLTIDHFYFISFFGKLMVALAYFLPGLLLYLRNKKKIQDKPAKPLSDVSIPAEPVDTHSQPAVAKPEITPIDRVIGLLEQVRATRLTQETPAFSKEVSTSIDLLSEIKNEGFSVEEDLLEHIGTLSVLFLEVEDNKIQTSKSRQILTQIEDTFFIINEALENIYDKNFDLKATAIEEEIITLKTKLNLKGELDTPFEKLKKKMDLENQPDTNK